MEERRQGMTDVLVAIEGLRKDLSSNNKETAEVKKIALKTHDRLFVANNGEACIAKQIERNTMFRRAVTWAVSIAVGITGVIFTAIKLL